MGGEITSNALGIAMAEVAVATVARTRTSLENIVVVRSSRRINSLQKASEGELQTGERNREMSGVFMHGRRA